MSRFTISVGDRVAFFDESLERRKFHSPDQPPSASAVVIDVHGDGTVTVECNGVRFDGVRVFEKGPFEHRTCSPIV